MFYRALACAGIVDGIQQNIVRPHSWAVFGLILAAAFFWTMADGEASEAARVSSAKQG
jgi:hypothetical protein